VPTNVPQFVGGGQCSTNYFPYTAVISGIPNGGPAPTGTVTFSANGGAVIGTETVQANGTATVSVVAWGVTGTNSISASYSGDSNYLASSTPVYAFSVVPAC
jgi:hypothetical protein